MRTPLVARVRYLLLVPILALAFFIAYIPHRNYAYPVHLDEWQVMVFTNALMEKASTAQLTNPIYGGDDLTWNQMGELGTHIFWGAFKEVTGLDWLVIFRYFPGIVYMITVLSVFILAGRQGFGWQAAFFASLLPTTVGILGPAFLVPISLAMLFIPLALFVAFNFRSRWSYPVLSALVVAPAAIHPPTAAVLIVILAPYILLNLKGSPRHSLGMALAVLLPFVALFPVIYRIAVPMVKRLFVPQSTSPFVDLPSVIPTLGYVTILLCLGRSRRSGVEREADGLRSGPGRCGLAGPPGRLLFAALWSGNRLPAWACRLAMLMVSILAGAGLGVVGAWGWRSGIGDSPGRLRLSTSLRPLVTLALVAVTLFVTIPARLHQPYYQMLDSGDYRAFTWIRANLGDGYGKALLDPVAGHGVRGPYREGGILTDRRDAGRECARGLRVPGKRRRRYCLAEKKRDIHSVQPDRLRQPRPVAGA